MSRRSFAARCTSCRSKVADVETRVVFEYQRRFERIERHFIKVEEARVAFIRREEERFAIVTPAREAGFHFIAGRQVPFAPISLAQVKMVVFVAAPIVGVEKS